MRSDIVCFSVNSFTIGYMLKIAKSLYKKSYKGKVILRGVHATHYPKDIIKNEGVDYVVCGEAEETLLELIKCIELNKEIAIHNVYYKGSETIESKEILDIKNLKVEDFVFPAYDLIPDKVYESLTVETSRGCFGNCTFCSVPNKKIWRPFPKEYIVENIKRAMHIIENKFNAKSIIFTDDCFTMDVSRACDLLEIFYDLGLKNYSMLIESRLAQLTNEKLIYNMKKFKNIMIQVGIECGYNLGLKKINKGIKVEQIIKVSESLYNNGLAGNVFFSFIIGFPWETAEACMETLNFMSFIKKEYGIKVNCCWWIPVPSIDFEILKSMDNSIDNDIYNVNGWLERPNNFGKVRPLLSEQDIYLLNEKIYIDELRME